MKKFGFQTVETKPNKKVWISDSWDPTEHSNFRHWDQTEQKSSNFRHLGPNRTKKLGFQTVGTKPNVRFSPICLKSELFVPLGSYKVPISDAQ